MAIDPTTIRVETEREEIDISIDPKRGGFMRESTFGAMKATLYAETFGGRTISHELTADEFARLVGQGGDEPMEAMRREAVALEILAASDSDPTVHPRTRITGNVIRKRRPGDPEYGIRT